MQKLCLCAHNHSFYAQWPGQHVYLSVDSCYFIRVQLYVYVRIYAYIHDNNIYFDLLHVLLRWLYMYKYVCHAMPYGRLYSTEYLCMVSAGGWLFLPGNCMPGACCTFMYSDILVCISLDVVEDNACYFDTNSIYEYEYYWFVWMTFTYTYTNLSMHLFEYEIHI